MSDDLMAALDAALAGVSEAFKEAPANTGSIYDLPPDGDYQALVHEFEFIPYPAGGIGLKVRYQITNHSLYGGRICGDLMTISEERIAWLKGWLAKMGVDVDTLDLARELRPDSGTLTALLDTPVMIKVKRNQARDGSGKVYENVYLQQMLGEWGSGASARVSDVPGAAQGEFDGGGFAMAPPAHATRGMTDLDDIPF